MAHGGRARGGTREQCKRYTPPFWFLKNLTTGLIWLLTRVGGWGEAWGGGPWSSVGAIKGALFFPFGLP